MTEALIFSLLLLRWSFRRYASRASGTTGTTACGSSAGAITRTSGLISLNLRRDGVAHPCAAFRDFFLGESAPDERMRAREALLL